MSRLALLFERQWLHVGALALLLLGLERASWSAGFRVGSLGGVSSLDWAWIAVALAIAHQFLVWFCWRTELHVGLMSRMFGSVGFVVYAVLFSIIGIARTVAVWLLAISNQGTVDLSPWILRSVAVILLVPALYVFYSVRRFFTFRRAFGIDHFDTNYRTAGLVREGIFRWTRNGMYTFGFLILWVPAFWWGSEAALWVALFNHLYIWVHYFATERPDMRRIYGFEMS